MNDIILPNLAQAGAICAAGDRPKAFSRAGLSRWTVPIDDTHSLVIGVRHFNEGVNDPLGRHNEADCGKGKVDFVGQTGDRPYAERQRIPGRFQCEVSLSMPSSIWTPLTAASPCVAGSSVEAYALSPQVRNPTRAGCAGHADLHILPGLSDTQGAVCRCV
jgi:hypothetical protein